MSLSAKLAASKSLVGVKRRGVELRTRGAVTKSGPRAGLRPTVVQRNGRKFHVYDDPGTGLGPEVVEVKPQTGKAVALPKTGMPRGPRPVKVGRAAPLPRSSSSGLAARLRRR